MAKFVHSDVLDNGINGGIKAVATHMLLLSTYTFGDSYATVTGNSVADVAMVSGDYTITSSGNNRVLTTASGKSATATANTQQYEAGTATGGSTITLADTTKTWVVNAHTGRAVTITSGTGAGQVGVIASNTATVLTIATAWGVAPDGTSTYRISDNLHIAFTDGTSKVLWVTDETSNQSITLGNTIVFPSLQYTSNQPV